MFSRFLTKKHMWFQYLGSSLTKVIGFLPGSIHLVPVSKVGMGHQVLQFTKPTMCTTAVVTLD